MQTALTETRRRRAGNGEDTRNSIRASCILNPASRLPPRGFTLVEVMIASGILFLCLFAILGLLANLLRNARVLQRVSVDAGTVAAYFSSTTNLHQEGIESGSFNDLGDFSDKYRELEWSRESTMFGTNGLWFEVYSVRRKAAREPESTMSTVEFDPAATKAQGAKP
jgi:type II secretory pathway pseudopilin PulG